MKISIITPAYNQANFIEKTINSVLKQDYNDIEYIVLDDGSSDDIEIVVSPYMSLLKYVRHENMGESKTVNKGYRLSTGDVIGVVNSDDPLFTNDAVSRIAECFQNNPNALAIYPDWVSIDQVGNVLSRHLLPQYDISNMLENFNVALGPGMFIKRSALEKIGYRNEELRFTGDLDISFRLALIGELIHIPAILATHRIHSNATSSTCQGSLMAEEVLRLAKVSLDSTVLSPSIVHKSQTILANAHFIASDYCGNNRILRLQLIAKSLYLDPNVIWNLIYQKIFPQIQVLSCFMPKIIKSAKHNLYPQLRLLRLLIEMSKMEIRKRYLGTLLGSTWAVLSPLINTGLIYVVMIYGLKVGGTVGDVPYVSWLISGMLAWFFILEVLSSGSNTIIENPHLVTKIQFPLRLLVMVRVVSAMPVHILLMLILMLLMAVQGVGSFAYWLQLIYYFVCAAILTLGINFLTSAAQVFTRDVGSIMGVVLQGLFWATPIFWRADLIINSKFDFLLYSPFAYIITGYRDSLFDAIPFWQRPVETIIFWVVSLSILFFAKLFFQRVRPHFADML